ncbi:hypothetical protein [Flaviflexus equikiangi]|uniref:Lipoprotein n=1 Tax=Flaviflexus equikiangi TaxID=2758573 RepID=A0ABS2TD61_9ACTO|nr:hypothetical protein [Flaviflexus equikiangi]MBM9432589.1 hypothetical protein [Flaviflexus equikiangi]
MKKLVALVGAGLLMAACSANPSSAAQVNGETITIAELAQVQADFQDNGVNSLADGVLNMMINAEVANEIIADAGLSVPEEMRQTVFSQLGLNPDGEYSAATDEMIDFLAFTLVVQQGLYTADEINPVLTALGEADVEVNPRFGTWDSENFAIAPLVRDYVTSEQPSI